MPMFAVMLTYVDDTEKIRQVRPAHREHLKRQLDAGRLYHAGPFLDDTGGMAIYVADSEEEVREILANDPFTIDGVITEVRVKAWELVFNAAATAP